MKERKHSNIEALYDIQDIKSNLHKDVLANNLAEGNEPLCNLLKYLWDNNINTNACCGGHYNNLDNLELSENSPYLSIKFKLTDKNIHLVDYLSKYIIDTNNKTDLPMYLSGSIYKWSNDKNTYLFNIRQFIYESEYKNKTQKEINEMEDKYYDNFFKDLHSFVKTLNLEKGKVPFNVIKNCLKKEKDAEKDPMLIIDLRLLLCNFYGDLKPSKRELLVKEKNELINRINKLNNTKNSLNKGNIKTM